MEKRKKTSFVTKKKHSIGKIEIDRIALMLFIPEGTKEHCREIYGRALENNLARGRSIEGILAASTYIACRNHNVPITINEIEKATKVERSEIMKICKLLSNMLKIRLPLASPLVYVSRFIAKLKLGKNVEEKATEIIKGAIKEDITSGKGPTTIAAAAIYLAAILCNNKRTQRDVADASGATEVTIRARCKEIASKLEIKID